MSVMSGACVSRARLQATDGAPMPTKHTSSFFSARAAAMAIISAVEYSMAPLRLLVWRTGTPVTYIGGKNTLPHPAEKRLALPRDPVPGGVEGVVAPVIAVGIGWVRAARRLDDSIDRPMRQHRGVRTRNAQVIDDLLHGHNHVGRRERGLLLHPDNPFDEHIPRAVRSLRVNDR